ncbi:MAG: SDR family oxidoreductase [Acidobacteria bacterium]|nr:SDR family oxidoreductase [Acidobacteriota bacterium]
MKYGFVTGATGFLGRHLTELLVEDGWQLTVLHRKTSDTRYLRKAGIRLAEGDVTDIDSLRIAMPEGLDAVFHTAADTSQWILANDRQTRVNVDGTRNMTVVAQEKGAKRFIHTSSIAEFGFHSAVITEETVSNAMHGRSNYMRTKWRAAQVVDSAVDRGLDAVFLNPCHIIGPYDTHNWSRLFFLIYEDRLPGIPGGTGTFCHVREVAAAHLRAFERGRKGERYILGGVEASFLELAREIAEVLGKRAPEKPLPDVILRTVARFSQWISYLTRREPDLTPEKIELSTEHLRASCGKAVRELGFRPVSLADMVRDCYDWLKSEGILARQKS